MKLTTMTQITIDGVVQGNGGASDEDRRSGFERGGWARGRGDKETSAFINETYQRADAFLLGRRTYEVFADVWGSLKEQDVPGWEPVIRALNSRRPKYVASNTLVNPTWSGTTVLSGDVAGAIRELKATPGGELQVHGSGTLIRWLLKNATRAELLRRLGQSQQARAAYDKAIELAGNTAEIAALTRRRDQLQ